MDFVLDANDLAALTDAQKNAVMDSLFLALAADGQIDADEAQKFEAEVAQIPWGLNEAALRQMAMNARERVQKITDRTQAEAWIQEIAGQLPGSTLREKTLGTMAKIAIAGGLNQQEKNILNAFSIAFQIPEARMQQMAEALKKAYG